jgi:LmbE family N-acetylglucosaminyl deacetylase
MPTDMRPTVMRPTDRQRVLVVAAHPDDEVLGCGGTLAGLTAGGAFVHVAFLADGVFSRVGDEVSQRDELTRRREVARSACATLGVVSVSFGDFPDNSMDTVSRLAVARAVEELVATHRPDTVFTHHAGDVNVDHRRIHDGVVAACRPQPGHPVTTILCFEVPSSTEWQLAGHPAPFVPSWFVDISAQLARKAEALRAYHVEMRPWPHARSYEAVDHLQRWRGATVGVEAAEAFVLGRRVERA